MRRRDILILAAVALVFCAAFSTADFIGFWIPNLPPLAAFPVRGIDVSGHQGSIQWDLVPHDEIHFVYIKATEGGDFRDAHFTENWKSSADAGFRRGAYHFRGFTSPRLPKGENWLLWQFSERLRVRGTQGYVDHNVFNGQKKEFESFLGRIAD